MRQASLGTYLLLFIICYLFIGNNQGGAEEPPDSIRATFVITLKDGVRADIDCVIDVQRVTLSASGTSFTKSDIDAVASSSLEMLGAIKYAIKEKTSDQLQQSFSGAIISSKKELPTYQDQQFHDEYELFLSSPFFGLNDTVDSSDFINGMLDIGAIVNYSFSLSAHLGWNNSFTFHLPSYMSYRRTTGNVIGSSILWDVKNWDGEHSKQDAALSVYEKNPTTPENLNQTIDVLFNIDCRSPDAISLSHVLSAEAIDVKSYVSIPSFLSNVDVLPADALRLWVGSSLLTWESIYEHTMIPLNEELVSVVEDESFNQSLEMDYLWFNEKITDFKEPYNKTHMDNVPPVTISFIDEKISLLIDNVSAKALFGLVNAGANVTISKFDVNFGQSLDDLHQPFTAQLMLPPHVYLNDSNIFQWQNEGAIAGSFTSTVAESYSNQVINAYVDIEVLNTDLNLLSFFTGKTELRIGFYIKEKKQNHVISVPSEFSLPDSVDLSLLNADAVRVCILEDVFSDDAVNMYLSHQRLRFMNLSTSLFPLLIGNAQIDRDAFDESLDWDDNISSMDADSPIEVVSYMQSSYPLSFYFSMFPPTFEIASQNLSLTGIKDESVTYSMVFPAGVSIDIEDTLNRAKVETIGDQVHLSVSFNASEGNVIDVVSYRMHPSLLYIIGMFTPCIISIFITVVLFIVVFLMRKKRNRFRRERGYEKTKEDHEFENQEYYIPPPPPSSRK